MKATRLYEDKKVVFEKFDNGDYRVTFFNDDCHWHGDITFTENGLVYSDLGDDDQKVSIKHDKA